MVANCPLGHVSATDDYCDECGTPLTGADGSVADTNRSHRTEVVSAGTRAHELCPRCRTALPAGDRFCEGCGHDFTSLVEAQTQWVATVAVDRAHFERTAPPELDFPAGRPPATVPLHADEVLIGRRSESRGVHPDIDLSGPLDDPAVSHRHARLTRTVDGSYTLTDLGSTNGTSLNDDGRPLVANVPVALGDGDHILLGAWTVITVRPAASTD